MDIKEISLTDESAQKVFKNEHCNISADLAGILARAIIESYKAELLKEVGEPVGYHYLPNNEMFPVEEVSRSNLKNNPQDYVFLYTSDQVAAAILEATRPLEEEVERLKVEGSIYKNNNTIRQENHELRAQLAAAQEEINLLKAAVAHEADVADSYKDQLAKAEQRKWIDGYAGIHQKEMLSDTAKSFADRVRDGEWRKFVKEV